MRSVVVVALSVVLVGCIEVKRAEYPPISAGEIDLDSCVDDYEGTGWTCCTGRTEPEEATGECLLDACDMGDGFRVVMSTPEDVYSDPLVTACLSIGPNPCWPDGPHGVGPWPFTEFIWDSANNQPDPSGGMLVCDF